MTVLVTLDGVLRTDTGAPIPEGVRLVESLRDLGRLVLLVPGSRAEAEHWLRVHGVRAPDDVLDASVTLHEGDDLHQRQVTVARSRGAVDFLVSGDPDLVIHGISRGIASVLFSHPILTPPKHRPDNPRRRSWEDIVSTMEKQAEYRANTTSDDDWRYE